MFQQAVFFLKRSGFKFQRRCGIKVKYSTVGTDEENYQSVTSTSVHEHKLTRPKPKLRIPQDDIQGSLIPETLKDMEREASTGPQLRLQSSLERLQRQRALDTLGIPKFVDFCGSKTQERLNPRKRDIEVLQLNIGLYCNQACSHCHVESSPKRIKDVMTREVAERCLQLLQKSSSIHTVDVTGGAPELCPEFRYLVGGIVDLNKKVIDRCNLTALLEPGQEDTPIFLADHKVEVIASLPCYSAKNVNLQRGSGVFQRSIKALQLLNDLGYGIPGSNLVLNLVYNPLGAFLPPNQDDLEIKYKDELESNFGVYFNNLFTMNNMPIKRFADFLYRRNELKDYMQLLVNHFNPNTLNGLMCRNSLSVDYQGNIFDCDFNQQLNIKMKTKPGQTVMDIESFGEFAETPISFENHCFGCTAGHGSS